MERHSSLYIYIYIFPGKIELKRKENEEIIDEELLTSPRWVFREMVVIIVTRKAVLNTVMGECLAQVFYVLWLERRVPLARVEKYDSVIRITFTILFASEGRMNWKLAVAESITINPYWRQVGLGGKKGSCNLSH